jgi:hypothetical protein
MVCFLIIKTYKTFYAVLRLNIFIFLSELKSYIISGHSMDSIIAEPNAIIPAYFLLRQRRVNWGAAVPSHCLRPLEHWGRGLECHSRHGCLSTFILCLCYPV